MEETEKEPTFDELMAALSTEKQRRFVQEYLVDLCAGAAAKRAGYSEDSMYTIGWENLRKPDIHAAVVAGLQVYADQAHISKAWIINQLKANHQRSIDAKDRQAANRALDLLGKALGMFDKDLNVNLNHTNDARVVMYFPDNQRGPTPKGKADDPECNGDPSSK